MVRRPERAHAFTHTTARENTGHGVNRDHFKSFVLAEPRQYRRHSPREHGFAGARWPDQQDIMSTPGCHLERAFCSLLADDIREVGCVTVRSGNAADFTSRR